MPFLIDGHNVIAALPDIDLEDPDDEAKLVMKLRAWSGRARRKAIVIFDGGIPGGPSRVLSTPEVRVVFAAKYHSTADRIIKERLSALPDAPNWTVVSSDHEVLDNAREIGAKVLTAQEFAERLNQVLEVEKEKPEATSAGEVAAWLEIFETPEPPPAPEPQPPPITPEPAPTPPAPKPPRRPERVAPAASVGRTTRTIGEQIGMPPPPEKPRRVADKPEEVSPEEVASWLEVFHDTSESDAAPPPRKPQPQKPARPAKPLSVKKQGGLSEDEVETWLELFGGEPEVAETPPASSKQPSAVEKKPKPAQSRLVKRKQQLVSTEDEETGTLSKEEQELWRRMYGRGDAI
ncbi:MAG TPA: NYN domain-containing protein [Anaerolineae bacterium]|nr:NYN domain-containing protein [Anaerolineae bacterium]HQK15363.1 NYN domain-containing protein [Anaerolineae bacterium]